MSKRRMNRRDWLQSVLGAGLAAGNVGVFCGQRSLQVAPFVADVTPPLGHPLLGGWIAPARSVRDPLEAKGLVLQHGDQRWVLCALDWCELRNDAYDRFRSGLARAAKTAPDKVLLACVHQHDAPYADWHAQQLLDEAGLRDRMFQREFFLKAVERVARAAREACRRLRPVDQIGVGHATVARVACNRRVVLPDGRASYARSSFVQDLTIRNAPEGEIDPTLRMISFWRGQEPVAAICSYAVHPMSRYGLGQVSGDFPAEARRRWEAAHGNVPLVYFTGAAGDTTASKYNDGTDEARHGLAARLADAMHRAWQRQRRFSAPAPRLVIDTVAFRPDGPGHRSEQEYARLLAQPGPYFRRVMAALTLSWFRRCRAGRPVPVWLLEFGAAARFLLLPAEAFVAFQLAVHRLWQDGNTVVSAYGECAPGYIPTEKARAEGFAAGGGYCWVAPGAEKLLLDAIKRLHARSARPTQSREPSP